MKKALFIFTFILVCTFSASSQNIAIGERVPELKITMWLSDSQPTPTTFTYIEFFHPSNPACIKSLDQLRATASQMGGRLRILIVTQEREEKVSPLLTPYLSDRIGVGFDTSGKTFSSFGVSYVPFGVLVDAKNRALWLGNSLQINPTFIDKISK